MSSPRRAVVVGVDHYKDATIPPLRGAVNDATELCARLRTSGEFEIREDHFLVDERATCRAIRKAISDLLWRTDEQSLSLFYFSGHGFQDAYHYGYLAPHDIARDEPLVSGIRMQELKEISLKAKNKQVVLLILDCCSSGIPTEDTRDASPPVPETDTIEHCFKPGEEEEEEEEDAGGRGRVILASAGKDERSREDTHCKHTIGAPEEHCHGVFSFHLLEGLNGRASDAGGFVTLGGLRRFIAEQMMDYKEHKLTYYAANVSQEEEIIIVKVSEMHNIGQKLQSARAMLETRGVQGLFCVIDEVSEIIRRNPNFREAEALKNSINAQLEHHGILATAWLMERRKEIQRRLPSGELYSKLERFAARLTFECIVEQEALITTLLCNLCRAASNDLELEDFFRQLVAVHHRLDRRLSVAGTELGHARAYAGGMKG